MKTDELLTQTNFHEYLPIKESCEKKLKVNENIRKPKLEPFWFETIRKMSKGSFFDVTITSPKYWNR